MIENDNLTKVKKFYFRNKRLPTYSEMKRLFGYASPHAVAYVVHKWVKEGIIQMADRKLAPGDQFFSLPLLGVIKAGSPTTDPEYESQSVSLDDYLIGNPGYSYLLRVSGDSMINEGIRSGDLVILDKKKEPKSGDVIAALVDNEWTLKYYKNDNGRVYLEAANPNYQPIFPKESLVSGGVVVKVIREYY
jgi:repressor LexA